MRLGVRPDTPAEWLALQLNLVPVPMADTHLAFQFARIVMAASKAGLFEALREQGHTSEEVAAGCGTDRRATAKMLDALLAHGYLNYRSARYELNRLSRKWLLADSPYTLVHKLDLQEIEWRWTEGFDAWLRDGVSRDLHGSLTPEEWRRYQWGMRDFATAPAKELTLRTRLPGDIRALLDIGGSHGFYSVELCRRYPKLNAIVLELPEAIPTAADILAREGMGARVRHRPGNVLEEDLGDRVYDAVLVAGLAHHFTNEQNQALAMRVARALRPGGVFMIMDAVRIESPDDARKASRRVGAVLDVYFAMTSNAGTWSIGTLQDWQRKAGLKPRRATWLRTVPGAAVVTADLPK
jgi:SAM-dependent methyltransferase